MSLPSWCQFCGNPSPECGLHIDSLFGVPVCKDQEACWNWGVRRLRQQMITFYSAITLTVTTSAILAWRWRAKRKAH